MATRRELCQERERNLDEALERIENVIHSLDTRTETCDCCGQIGRTNWEEFQASSVLEGVVRRIQRALESDIIDPEATVISGVSKPRKGGSNDGYEAWKPDSG